MHIHTDIFTFPQYQRCKRYLIQNQAYLKNGKNGLVKKWYSKALVIRQSVVHNKTKQN